MASFECIHFELCNLSLTDNQSQIYCKMSCDMITASWVLYMPISVENIQLSPSNVSDMTPSNKAVSKPANCLKWSSTYTKNCRAFCSLDCWHESCWQAWRCNSLSHWSHTIQAATQSHLCNWLTRSQWSLCQLLLQNSKSWFDSCTRVPKALQSQYSNKWSKDVSLWTQTICNSSLVTLAVEIWMRCLSGNGL